MRHALWLLSFVSAIGFAQSAPQPAPLLSPPTPPSVQLMPAPQAGFSLQKRPVYIPSGKAFVLPKGAVLFMAPPICSVPLVRAPLSNSEKMPVSVPPVISDEKDISVPAPACDELADNRK